MTEAVRVLCVDDEPQVLELTEAYLERELPAAELLTATGTAAALDALEGERVDCVVSDYDMPDGTGIDLLRSVRADHPDLPFVLFTGKGSEEVGSEAVSAGVTDYLQKAGPEKFELLANRIRDAVDQRRVERDLDDTRRTLEQLHETALDLRAIEGRAEAYDHALEAAVEVLAFDVCGFFEAVDGYFELQAASSFESYGEDVAVTEGLVGATYRTGESSLVGDVADDERAVNVEEHGGSALTVPVGDHGVFQAVAGANEQFDEADLELVELLVAHLAAALDRVDYRTEATTANRKVGRLHDVALALREADDRAAVYDDAAAAATEVLEFDVCGFFELRDGRFEPVALRNIGPDVEPLAREEGIMAETFDAGESLVVDDVTDHPAAAPRGEAFRACVSVPAGDHGVFQAISEQPGAFDERDRELAELLVAHVTGALDRIVYEADVRRASELLETVMESARANVYVKDLEGRYELVNEAFARGLGMDREAIVGRTDEEIQDPEVAAQVRANDRRAIEEARPIEVESALWDGEERTYYSVKAPVFAEDGDPRGVCGVSSDITALKRRETELERKTERLEAFASVVSHDLRNPLSVAKGYAELLAEDGSENAAEVDAALDRMAEIIDDLLALAREGEVLDDTEQVAVADVAERAWSTVETGGATLSVDCDLTVEADANRLARAFENLFRNAVEHNSRDPRNAGGSVDHDSTSRSGGDDAVDNPMGTDDAVDAGPERARHAGRAGDHDGASDLSVRVLGTERGFAVVDDGVGLSGSDVVESGVSSKRDGTGVGLAIVDRIADAHGWELVVRDDDGAHFAFVL
jgi:PAS domain S-box-containing protein